MSFKIDRQSVGELNLMGKFRQGSVYFLFNKVKTRIGEKLMDEMFSHPLTDAAAINRRAAIFQYFERESTAFPFEADQVALMREFIDGAAGKSQLATTADTWMMKMLASVAKDGRYKNILLQLQATIVTLKKCFGLLELLRQGNSPCSSASKHCWRSWPTRISAGCWTAIFTNPCPPKPYQNTTFCCGAGSTPR
ncbi:hypothetical protein WJU16_22645 [Chitinophaga pollutisoli]|uniref:Uncharacterized protein n=1 Tax=Chitinophaga pollutisoli TaxID=3133966 RepID=A0ABZ2YMS0_9BACT